MEDVMWNEDAIVQKTIYVHDCAPTLHDCNNVVAV